MNCNVIWVLVEVCSKEIFLHLYTSIIEAGVAIFISILFVDWHSFSVVWHSYVLPKIHDNVSRDQRTKSSAASVDVTSHVTFRAPFSVWRSRYCIIFGNTIQSVADNVCRKPIAAYILKDVYGHKDMLAFKVFYNRGINAY